jgi:hypothetical protein
MLELGELLAPLFIGENMNTTKETKEALQALITIVGFLAERLKDGAGIDDLVAVFSKLTSDDVFKKKIKEGYEGLDKVAEELKKLDATAITALGFEVAPDIVDLLLKLKANKTA